MMKYSVCNVIEVENPTAEFVEFCEHELVVNNPDYDNAVRLGLRHKNIDEKIFLYAVNGQKYVIPFGCIRKIFSFKNFTYTLNISPFKGNNLKGDIKLYDYQYKAINALIRAKGGVLKAPCGSGKTQIGLALIKAIGGRALRLTHTSDLLKQSYERCKAYFSGDFGLITGGKVEIGKDITFATVQTMCKVDTDLYKNAFDIVIVDECHHCVGSPSKMMMFYKVVNNINCRYKYGMSATPKREDGLTKAMYALLGDIAYEINIDEVGEKRIQAEHIRVDIPLEWDITRYSGTDGIIDYNALIDMLSMSGKRNKIVCDNILSRKGHKQLVLCHRVEHLDVLAEYLKQHGLNVSVVSGKVAKNKRNFDADVVIATYALAKEGLDIPELDTLHLVTPQKNESTTIQAVGRVERNVKGKEIPIVFDYVDVNIPYCVKCFLKRKRIIKKNKK